MLTSRRAPNASGWLPHSIVRTRFYANFIQCGPRLLSASTCWLAHRLKRGRGLYCPPIGSGLVAYPCVAELFLPPSTLSIGRSWAQQ